MPNQRSKKKKRQPIGFPDPLHAAIAAYASKHGYDFNEAVIRKLAEDFGDKESIKILEENQKFKRK